MSEKLILKKLDNIETMLQQQNINTKEVLSFSEASILLDVSHSHLYKLTSTKQIPHYCPQGKKLYFERAELLQWMKKTQIKSNI
jgi:excisionase family DNA binding protein